MPEIATQTAPCYDVIDALNLEFAQLQDESDEVKRIHGHNEKTTAATRIQAVWRGECLRWDARSLGAFRDGKIHSWHHRMVMNRLWYNRTFRPLLSDTPSEAATRIQAVWRKCLVGLSNGDLEQRDRFKFHSWHHRH
jgi:hypothetical protein